VSVEHHPTVNIYRYNHLKKTGTLSKLQKAHPELGLVRPRSEGDLEIEIEGLRRSTELLRQHATQLRRQKAALKAMKDKTKADRERKRKLDGRRRRKWLSQREDLQAAVSCSLVRYTYGETYSNSDRLMIY